MADNVQAVNDASFQAEVIDASKTQPVMVDFWAEWCRPCRHAFADRRGNRHAKTPASSRVVKMNVDENMGAPPRYNIRGIPTLLVFKGGQVADQIVGNLPKDQIVKILARHIRLRIRPWVAPALSAQPTSEANVRGRQPVRPTTPKPLEERRHPDERNARQLRYPRAERSLLVSRRAYADAAATPAHSLDSKSHRLGVQFQFRRGNQFPQLLEIRRAGNRRRDARPRHQPRQRHASRRRIQFLRHFIQSA